MSETVVVIGASPRPDRYSHRAVVSLKSHGHRVIPIHAVAKQVAGIPVVHDLRSVEESVDTVTVYVRPEVLRTMLDELIALQPKRIIFNPGTEDNPLIERLTASGLNVVEACTLVMLSTGQF